MHRNETRQRIKKKGTSCRRKDVLMRKRETEGAVMHRNEIRQRSKKKEISCREERCFDNKID
jgi:hypothetical protein